MTNSEKIDAFNLERQYMNNSLISNVIRDMNVPDNVYMETQKGMINQIELEFMRKNIELDESITMFDTAVMDAIYTLIISDCMIFSAQEVGRVLTGDPKKRINQSLLSEITQSIDKLRYINIKINCEKEMKMRNKAKFIYESYLLPLEKIQATYSSNGTTCIAYKALKMPALYEYAAALNQIMSVPARLYEVEKCSNKRDHILIKRYVIKRVQAIKSKNKLNSNKISFEWFDRKEGYYKGLFYDLEYIPIDPPGDEYDEAYEKEYRKWKKTKSKIIKIVKLTLDHLVKLEIIKGYQEYRKDGTHSQSSPIMGFEISV